MTTSEAQIASNRENAQKSTGPRSIAGRATVAGNSVTHGLTGRFRLLDGESHGSLDTLIAQLTAEHHPYRETEAFLVRQLAELQLRINRASSLETELMLVVVDPGSPADTPHAILAREFLKDGEFGTVLLRLNRYEGSLRRTHLATLRELRQQQKCRQDESPFIDVPSISEMIKSLKRRSWQEILPPRPPRPPRSRSTKQTQFPPRRPLPPPSTPPDRSKSTPSSDPKLLWGRPSACGGLVGRPYRSQISAICNPRPSHPGPVSFPSAAAARHRPLPRPERRSPVDARDGILERLAERAEASRSARAARLDDFGADLAIARTHHQRRSGGGSILCFPSLSEPRGSMTGKGDCGSGCQVRQN